MSVTRTDAVLAEALLAVARGDEPADLVIENARVVDVVAGVVRAPTRVAIFRDRIAGIGEGYRGRSGLDLEGRFLAPGFIDAHVHVESSLVPPREYARAVVPRGVTTVVTNPHEIANVLGVPGIRFMLQNARGAPLDVLATLPSCVPATDLATTGARLDLEDLIALRDEPEVLGLGEVMDFPAAVAGSPRLLAELRAFEGRPVDGHAPGLRGPSLQAYGAAGITSDHECTTPEEAADKLRAGMRVFVREGSAARNLEALLPAITPWNERWVCWCTDDRGPADLLEEGSIDHLVCRAVALGLDPMHALRLATLNAAEHFRLWDRGVVAPGRRADLVEFRDLRTPRADRVFRAGRLVARDGRLCADVLPLGETPEEDDTRNTVRIAWDRVDLSVPAQGRRVRVIGVAPGTLFTRELTAEARIQGRLSLPDPERDLAKLAVIERHRGTGQVGLGFVRGLGLQRGALASTVAHDHHNLIAAGADERSLETAARAVAAAGGGQAVAVGESVLALLPLPIAGIMSDRPIEEVRRGSDAVNAAARELGCPLHEPFMALSFLALEVIPALKLTDRGLVDVGRGRIVPLFLDD